ncbi:hypothetical protein [Microbulbifer variabilis]|uniref:hypothetical protein n=1 Tax=Microbulbifer variabilis TaxID=266805 RepID=UPI001CFCE4FC|nr:hypothetical protein [Microbulbifer variabilis]
MALFVIPASLLPDKQMNNKSTIKLILDGKNPTANSPINNPGNPGNADKPKKAATTTKPKVKGQGEVLSAAAKPAAPKVQQKRKAPNRKTTSEHRSQAVITQPENLPSQKDATLEVPAASGAKSKAIVFDPKLKRILNQERNRVRPLESSDALYTTATGTFVQLGDKCFDLKDLPAGSDSDLNPWFRTKCPKNTRSQADINRLAEKYRIP